MDNTSQVANNQLQGEVGCESEAPHFSLSLQARNKLSIADTFDPRNGILFTLHREQDSSAQPCIPKWQAGEDGFASPGFILLHHAADGEVKKLDLVKDDLHLATTSQIVVPQSGGPYINEVQPGASISIKSSLPKVYREKLIPGERYELLWPGMEIDLWDWGSISQHVGRELKPRQPKIILPGGPRILFKAVEEWEPLRFPSPPPTQPSERVPGAPILHLELEPDGPTTLNNGKFSSKVTIKVTYLRISGSTDQRPITFHTFTLQEPGFRFHRFRNQQWEEIEPVDGCLGIADNPDVEVNVSKHRDFASLQPGESWTASYLVDDGDWYFPSDLADGDVLRFLFKGGQVEWWVWGDSEDHSDTTVKLPCFVWSYVIEPEDNGGRPKLIVPVSNEILFTYRD
ncbi:hypothetical protein FQN54_009893 [Arachnomyces sp. PD_36]|nr:hypothetical protein FQN54_009893 [Arachnomyces sp. PD_36]